MGRACASSLLMFFGDSFASSLDLPTADGEAAIVTTVGTAKPNVKKYPVSSRRLSLLGPVNFTLRFPLPAG